MVARITNVDRRPAELRNVLAVRAPKHAGEAIRAELELGRAPSAAAEPAEPSARRIKPGSLRYIPDKGIWRAEMATEADAIAAVREIEASPPASLVGEHSGAQPRAFRWASERPYTGRGWCVLESGATGEFMSRLCFYPQV